MGSIGWSRIAGIAGSLALIAVTTGCLGRQTSPQSAGSQGWNSAQQAAWYGGKQGSRLMPYAWMKALEQAGNDRPFLAGENMERFRFLARKDQPLPIGFAVDDNVDDAMTFSKLRWYQGQGNREAWVGLNCAACHTAEIAYGDRPPLRIDGGPGLVDFQQFILEVDRALVATRDDPAKWERFAKAVLPSDNAANRALLKAELGRLIAWQERVAALDATTMVYGYGRLDAVGRIFNKVTLFSQPDRTIVNAPDAPVSYPFLWDIWRQDRLQWNGIARSARLDLGGDKFLDYGAMGRNTGEVIGVFGDIDTKPPRRTLTGFHSSVWADNLDRMEHQLRSLKAPAWPTGYLPAATGDAAQGRQIFDKSCKSCHGTFGPEINRYNVTMVPLSASERNRTDPWMACNAFTANSRSGNLTGMKEDFIKGRALAPIEPTGTLLATMVKGTLVGKKGQIIAQTANTIIGVNRKPITVAQDFPDTPDGRIAARLQRCVTEENELLAYKGRPLDGIWATAPYLHNGSVPTLYDLLLPPDRRPKSFHVGTRVYDPEKVGYVTARSAPGNSFLLDTELRGNSNAGHDYGVGRLSEPQRLALLAYLKTL